MSHPILYLPAGMEVPAKVAELHDECYLQIRSLPQRIVRIGDVRPEHLPSPGLLYLPNPYIVPGGRFNEMYGWDSYFIVLGLLQSGHYELARGMVDNFLFEIEHYGAVLNANRTYYLTRSQPPFLTAMVRSVYEDGRGFADETDALEWLETAFEAAHQDYATWTHSYRKAGDTGLTRFYDVDCGPVPELADDNRYFHHVIEWLLAHRDQDPGYLVDTRIALEDGPGASHAPWGCSPQTGIHQGPAMVDGYQLTDDFYRGDRAMRESGYDSSFRFGPFCGSTHHYGPVCLNSLLYRYEVDMAHFAKVLGHSAQVAQWKTHASKRAAALHRYCWQEDAGLFMDYNFKQGKASHYDYLSAYYPLWAGLATREQAQMLRDRLPLFERRGGLAMSSTESGLQWDEPYGWAPSNWMTVEGLYSYGFHDDACRIAKAFVATIDENFANDETVREKYDVIAKDIAVHITAGYKDNVIGFGWTNGVYLKMRALLES